MAGCRVSKGVVQGTLRAETHQVDITELAVTKADGCVTSQCLRLGQKLALEGSAQTTANGQLACTFYACMTGNNSTYLYVAVVCIHRLFVNWTSWINWKATDMGLTSANGTGHTSVWCVTDFKQFVETGKVLSKAQSGTRSKHTQKIDTWRFVH